MKKRLIFILLLCLQILSAKAMDKAEIDSLKRVIEALPHDSTRLVALKNIAQIKLMAPECILFADQLMQESKAQQNHKYCGFSAYLHSVYYYNQNKQDSVKKWIQVMEPYAQKAHLWDYYFDAKRFQIDMYSFREQFEFAINEANEMYRKAQEVNSVRGLIGAQQCLANAYIGTERWKEGSQALEKAHKLLPQIDNAIVNISVLSQLVSVAKENQNNNQLFQYLQELESTLQQHLIAHPLLYESFYDIYIFIEIYYIYYYLNVHRPELAHEHIQKATEYLNANTFFMYRVLYHDAYAAYYRYRKEYDKALAQIDTTIILLENQEGTERTHQESLKADILTEMGRSKEAFPIYQHLLTVKDSIDNSISDKQMAQIKAIYKIDKVMLEEEQLKNEIQITTLIIILIVLTVLLLFTVHMFRVRKALRHSESETRKATQIAEEANEMKNRFLSNMSYNIRIPLNGVVGFSQLIATDPHMDEATRKEFSAIIQKNSEELMRLVNDVLDLSRLEANMMKFQMTEYDVVTLCSDTVCMANMKNEGKIEVRFNNQIEGAQNITVDINRLTQALLGTLTYPQKTDTHREITFTISVEDSFVHFTAENTPLADPEFRSQEVSIRHDINRLLFEHFGGTYTVYPNATNGPTIVFTYPLSISE